MATIGDFQMLDIRVGKIIAVEDFPEARKPSYKLMIDFGELRIKKSSASIKNYEKEELVGRQIIAIVNFPPRQIATFLSEVLVLGALTDEGVILLQPEREAPLGAVIA
jgi:tRNA-binding protein